MNPIIDGANARSFFISKNKGGNNNGKRILTRS